MIGSNMAQTAMMMKLTPNICLYDPFAPALEGVAEELYHCGFEGVNLTYTSDIKEALTGASYIVSSGGAARKAGMTIRKRRSSILPERKTYCCHFQSGRHYRFDYLTVFRTETVSGFYAGSIGQHPSAKRTGEILPYPRFRHSELPHLRRSWRANGCLRFYR